jgi:hypothetical protein
MGLSVIGVLSLCPLWSISEKVDAGFPLENATTQEEYGRNVVEAGRWIKADFAAPARRFRPSLRRRRGPL